MKKWKDRKGRMKKWKDIRDFSFLYLCLTVGENMKGWKKKTFLFSWDMRREVKGWKKYYVQIYSNTVT